MAYGPPTWSEFMQNALWQLCGQDPHPVRSTSLAVTIIDPFSIHIDCWACNLYNPLRYQRNVGSIPWRTPAVIHGWYINHFNSRHIPQWGPPAPGNPPFPGPGGGGFYGPGGGGFYGPGGGGFYGPGGGFYGPGGGFYGPGGGGFYGPGGGFYGPGGGGFYGPGGGFYGPGGGGFYGPGGGFYGPGGGGFYGPNGGGFYGPPGGRIRAPALDDQTVIGKERDIDYQVTRMRILSKLLLAYPYKSEQLWEECLKDIRPSYRGQIWAALLDVTERTAHEEFLRLDITTEQASDRQLQGDIPRCHQYDELMTSPAAHYKLKHLLKAWLASEADHYVYWQGLDSLAAPFFVLHFNNLHVSIDNVVATSLNLYRSTPASCTSRQHASPHLRKEFHRTQTLTYFELLDYHCTRIAVEDRQKLVEKKRVLVVDLRSQMEHSRNGPPGSVSCPHDSSGSFDVVLQAIGTALETAKRNEHVICFVDSSDHYSTGAREVANGFDRVCVLDGGVNSMLRF